MSFIKKILIPALCVLLVFPLFSCSNKEKKAVGTCGSYEILYEELRFEALTYRSKNPDCTAEELEAAVKKALAESYAIRALCAEQLPDLDPDSKDIKKQVDEAFASAVESLGGKKEYKKYLKESYLTEHLMRRMLTSAQMQIELESKIFSGTELANNETLLAWLDDGNYVRVRSFFFPLTDADGTSMLEDAEEVRGKLQVGQKPDDVLTAAQKSAGAKYRPAEYYFRGMDGSEAEIAALSLQATGDISAVISAPDGYYILIRAENERDTLVNYQLTTVLDRYRSARLDELVAQAAASLTVVWNEYGSSIDLLEIK